MSQRVATFLIFIVNGAVVGTWLASVPGIQSSLALSGTEVGIVLLSMAFGALVSQQVTGQLLVRFSSERMVIATGLIFPLLAPLPLLAPSAIVLAVSMVAFGAMNTAMDVSMNAHGVALEERGGKSIFSGLHAGWSIGGLLGAASVGAAIAVGIGPVAEALVAAGVLWAAAFVAGRFLGTGSTRTEGARGIHWPSRAVLPVAVLVMLIAFVEGGLSDWGGIYLRGDIGSAAEVAAFAYAALALGMTLGRLGGDAVKDRLGSVRLIQVGMLLAAGAILVMLAMAHALVALIGLVVAGIGVANGIPQLFGAAGRIPPYGPSLSAAFTFLTIAFMVGPPLIGVTADATSVGGALVLLVAASVVAALAVARVPAAETNPRFRRGT